ncbi:hypothetical protein DPMN_154391 [Dreissena polymorpha]|uniref:Uncharacterized protein n=1 Tax=Dreissena polymorpha TaxID=45954 RepID=A0A9D4J6X8_DREPO|nr:hypothetical protein DPMN_154391 [Dreissena polymorpha]
MDSFFNTRLYIAFVLKIKCLQTLLVFDFLRLDKDGAFLLLSGRKKEVTAASVRDLLQFKYPEGNRRHYDEKTVQGFRKFLQATKYN